MLIPQSDAQKFYAAMDDLETAVKKVICLSKTAPDEIKANDLTVYILYDLENVNDEIEDWLEEWEDRA